jgi:hypothetical protein
MDKPTRKDTINLRVWKSSTGVQVLQGIVGVIDYPIAIHRDLTEFEQIQNGRRSRYSSYWCATHIPTGKSMGVNTSDWDALVQYVESIKDHPVLLMMNDSTMQNHPLYNDMVAKHQQAKRDANI